MAVSLVRITLGWLRGGPAPHKTKSTGAPPQATAAGGANGQQQTNVVQWKSRRKAQVEYREGRELWYTRMKEARTYEEWHLAAERLDEIEGHLEWKGLDASPHYDSKLLRERLRQVQQLEAQENMSSIVNWLRGGLQRNFVGSGNIELYEHSHVGTKTLIERHHCEMTRLLYEVANCSEDAMPLEKRLAFFTEARHALGKSVLLLSGGLGMGMYHLGVVKALHEQNLLPRIISASSFGAVVAAVVGTSTVDQLTLLFEGMFEQDGNICANLHEAQEDAFSIRFRRLLSKGLVPVLPLSPLSPLKSVNASL
jgi:TAG lipase/steryl ester hydrolase/phospholipase A2/LPA acyltransferase